MRTRQNLQADFGGGGGTNPAQGAVVWNPGAAPDPTGQYITTWAEVMTSFAESSGAFYVYLDDAGGGAFNIPAGTYNLDSRLSFARTAPAVGQLTVVMADGAVLQDPAGVYRNITLQMNPTALPAISMTNGRGIEFDLNARLENAGAVPGIAVGAGNTVFLGFYRASRAVATGAAIANLLAGSTLEATLQVDSQASVNWVTGTPSSTLTYRADSSFNAVTLGAPPGTVTTTRTDSYANIGGTEPGNWVTAFNEDLTAFPSVNMDPDGVYVVGGYTWTSLNAVRSQNLRFTNGTGLVLGPNTAGCNYINATRTQPLVLLRMGSIIPTFSADIHQMRVSARVSTFTATYNGPFLYLGFENLAAPVNEHAGVLLGRNSAARAYNLDVTYGATSAGLTDSNVSNADDTIQAEFNEATIRFRSATWAGTWPTDQGWRYRGLRNAQNVNLSEGRVTFDMNVIVCVDTNGTSGAGTNYDATITNLKIEYRLR